ncbi:phage head morphogenesis protein [Clostridium beijerinckii]|uniref:Uncharacterized protein n=1 Tax=Clostridium beijerinckii TaxID=1520 RepID=A0AAX0BAL8_CLOBE|nr:phage head morphogenesis protein [Clostridium beijerinckii]NRT91509.1 hypothetical protein [Clostridium beijerinckii]NYC71034.1 hypothetical protein [Clostridium beijerinckii]UYZ34156.1 phage head morphogenesis protein [Clostridium beijerinckii]
MDKNKRNKKEETEFIQGLYDEANKKIEEIYAEHKSNKDELLKEIAFVLLLYKINDSIMKLNDIEKLKLNKKFLIIIQKFFNKQVKLTNKVITEILEETAKTTFDFYGEKYTQKDIEDIVNQKYKDKVYIERITDNENKIANQLNNDIQEFIDGSIDVNTIKDNIDETYSTNDFDVRRLCESEVNRTENVAFILLAKEAGIKTIYRHEILDNKICLDCLAIDGQPFDIDNAPDGAIHSFCRGWNSMYK